MYKRPYLHDVWKSLYHIFAAISLTNAPIWSYIGAKLFPANNIPIFMVTLGTDHPPPIRYEIPIRLRGWKGVVGTVQQLILRLFLRANAHVVPTCL